MTGFFGTDDKVVALTGRRKDMIFPAVAEVRAYWEGLRGGRMVPNRSEVDPRGIERALEYAFVLERIAPRVARFRLAGMHLTDLMGMEVRGMPLTSLFAPQSRDEISSMLEAVFAGPATADLSLAAETGFGRPPLEARLLILPLKSDLGDVTRALGCLVSEGPIGRAPRRFVLDSARIAEIGGAEPALAAAPPAMRGFAEPPAVFAPAPRDRSHLRLVVSDE